jgi:Zn-dependent protease with chaperone function
MKHYLNAAIFLLMSITCFSQFEDRLQETIRILEETEPTIPASYLTTIEQQRLYKFKFQKKILVEKELLQKNQLMDDSYMTTLLDSIVSVLKRSNPAIDPQTEAYVFKSGDFNAFTLGDHILFVNAQLIYECRNVHELAFVIAHEIAHNTLRHSEADMVRQVLFETNDSIKAEIKAKASQQYKNVSALNELLLPGIMREKSISRANELSADSLAILYLKETDFDVHVALAVFEIMKYYSDAPQGVMDYTHMPATVRSQFEVKEKSYVRENSLGFQAPVENDWEKYLATHPYSDERVATLLGAFPFLKYTSGAIFYPQEIQKKLVADLQRVLFEKGEMSKYAFVAIEALRSIQKDEDVQTATAFCFYSLGFLKERFLAGKYLDRQSLNWPEDYDRLCYLLNSLNAQGFYSIATELKPDIDWNKPNLSIHEQLIGILQLTRGLDKEKLKIVWPLYVPDLKKTCYNWFVSEMENYLYSVKGYQFVKYVN